LTAPSCHSSQAGPPARRADFRLLLARSYYEASNYTAGGYFKNACYGPVANRRCLL
jgi:hypothetical protein